MNWGRSITLAFLLFAGFIGTFIYKMIGQRVDLVKDDYYLEELNYDQHLAKLANGKKFGAKIQFSAQNKALKVQLPANAQKASLLLNRPSNKTLDKSITINSNYQLDMNQMAGGVWKLQVAWTQDGQSCLAEESIFL